VPALAGARFCQNPALWVAGINRAPVFTGEDFLKQGVFSQNGNKSIVQYIRNILLINQLNFWYGLGNNSSNPFL
jgi:hypothetical protein